MKALLVHQGVQDALQGEEALSNNLSKKEKQDILDKAQSTRIMSLGDKALWEVSRETSAAPIWRKLESLYMTKSLANKLYLKQRLYSFKMQEGRSIEDQMYKFIKIINDLANVDVKIKDKYQVVKLLSSLSKSYEHFVDAMLYGKMQTLTMKEVKATLNSKELKKKFEVKTELEVEGLSI